MRARLLAGIVLLGAAGASAQAPGLPAQPGSIRFGIIGDMGTATPAQAQVGAQLVALQKKLAFPFVITVGDNIYGSDRPEDFRAKFELPYKAALDAGVKFYASLGNHDNASQRDYRHFNMDGKRFYSFKAEGDGGRTVARFYALDSTYMDKTQLDWFEKELAQAGKDDWKIVFFHHPLYSSARRHGSAVDLRKALEPLLVHYGVDVVFAGHDHCYERTKPQQGGIVHFVVGAGGSLRRGDLGGGRGSEITAKGFDQDYSFAVAEIVGDRLHFQAVSRTGATVDSGSLARVPDPAR